MSSILFVVQKCVTYTKSLESMNLHDKNKVYLVDTHHTLHATQLKQLTQTQTHLLHNLNLHNTMPKLNTYT